MQINNHEYKNFILKINGPISEDDNFEDLMSDLSNSISIDFKNCTGINSCGIRNLVNGLKLTEQQIEYINCPFFLVDQIFYVPELTKTNNIKIHSYQLNYSCLECLEQKQLTFNIDEMIEQGTETPEDLPCPCGEEMDLEQPIEFIPRLLSSGRDNYNNLKKTKKIGIIEVQNSLEEAINQFKQWSDYQISPVVIIDNEKNIAYLNKSFKTLTDYHGTGVGRLKPINSAIIFEEPGNKVNIIENCIKDREAIFKRNIHAYKSNGEQLTLNIHCQPILEKESKKLLGILTSIQDITMEESLYQSYKSRLNILKQSDQMRDIKASPFEFDSVKNTKSEFCYDILENVLSLSGRIDEISDFMNIFKEVKGNIDLDWNEVLSINSCGIRNWVSAIETLDFKLEHLNVPPPVLNNMISIPEMCMNGNLKSFYIQYECDSCDRVLRSLINIDNNNMLIEKYEDTLLCSCGDTLYCAYEDPEELQNMILAINDQELLEEQKKTFAKSVIEAGKSETLDEFLSKDGIQLIKAFNLVYYSIVIVDSSKIVKYFNPSVKIICSQVQINNKFNCHEIFNTEICNTGYCILEKAKSQKTIVPNNNISAKLSIENTSTQFEASAIPVLNDNNQFLGAILLYRDITTEVTLRKEYIKKLEQLQLINKELEIQKIELKKSKNNLELKVTERTHELVQSNKKLIEFDELKTRFFSNISHEFRTPLTLMVGPLESILIDNESELNSSLKEKIELIFRNTRRLLRLINQLLDLSKIESGNLNVYYKEKDLNIFIQNILVPFYSYSEQKGFKIIFHEGKGSSKVYIDTDKMEKVIYNLLSNSCKYTEKNGSIAVSVIVDDPDYIIISIKDTGEGISKDDLPYIFDRFQQAKNSKTNKTSGTGIGLALAKELVDSHKGKIEVDSTFGIGAEFKVYLLKGSEHVPKQMKNTSSEDSFDQEIDDFIINQSNELNNSGIIEELFVDSNIKTDDKTLNSTQEPSTKISDKILIVDDNADLRTYLNSILKTNYIVEKAENGKDALKKLKEFKPHLIISDVTMPEMNGYELCKVIKEDNEYKEIPIILLTAKASVEMTIEGLESGADEYLTKPFNSKELLIRTKNILTIRKQSVAVKDSYVKMEKAFKELKETKDKLVKIEKLGSLGVFSAGISHEINNPNNYISGGSQLALQEIENIEAIITELSKTEELNEILSPVLSNIELSKENISNVQKGSLRINEVVKGLMSFTKLNSPERSFVDINKLIEQTISNFKFLLQQRISIELRLKPIPELFCDYTSIMQVLMHILRNAIQAIKADGTIMISTSSLDKKIEIIIVDTGKGIEKEIISKIFDPFFTTMDVGEGLGLGLSICHGIIESHNGSIDIESKSGKGTMVNVTFPLEEKQN